MYFHTTELKTMTAAWLLPIVAPIVAAATGAIVADVLPNPQHALITIIVSYILWGTGVPLAMAVLVVYFQRLTIYKLASCKLSRVIKPFLYFSGFTYSLKYSYPVLISSFGRPAKRDERT